MIGSDLEVSLLDTLKQEKNSPVFNDDIDKIQQSLDCVK
jgi:hypothetical protein